MNKISVIYNHLINYMIYLPIIYYMNEQVIFLIKL